MKTIRFNTPAAWLLASLATLLVAGTIQAEESGKARLTDFGDDSTPAASASTANSDLIIRGASDLRRRNAQTSAALRRMFSEPGTQQAQHTQRPAARPSVQQVNGQQPVPCPPAEGCLTDACCPVTCAAPCDCCPVTCAAPEACCPPTCGCPPDACACPNPATCCAPACDTCCPTSCDGCAAVGHYRISDECVLCGGQGCSACLGDRCQSCPSGSCGYGHCQSGHCQHGHCQGGCPICNSGSCLNNNCFADFMAGQAAAHRARNRMASANLGHYLRCKLGYFVPDGSGGIGSPMFGHYSIVYPVDSGYSDSRDGQVYAAQGYGGAVSVPLAPVVRQAYNYGWGIPSSRLTPVSNNIAP